MTCQMQALQLMVGEYIRQRFLNEIDPFQKQKNVQLFHNFFADVIVFFDYLPVGSDPDNA